MMRYRLKVMAGYDIKIGHIITYRMRLNVITMKKKEKGNPYSFFLYFCSANMGNIHIIF